MGMVALSFGVIAGDRAIFFWDSYSRLQPQPLIRSNNNSGIHRKAILPTIVKQNPAPTPSIIFWIQAIAAAASKQRMILQHAWDVEGFSWFKSTRRVLRVCGVNSNQLVDMKEPE